MSQDPTNPSNPPEQAPPKKRRRLLLKIAIGLVVLVILLIALLPTIASTGMVRSVVLGKINEQINGNVQIDSWSLGWFSPMSASGIKVYDQDKRLILDVSQVKLGLSLLSAIRSNFALGDDNLVEVDSFLVHVDDAGRTNLERLPKVHASDSAPHPGRGGGPGPGGPPPAHASNQMSLPNISGKFTLKLLKGTIESEPLFPDQPKLVIHVDEGLAVATIPNINAPIQNNVKLVYHIGDADARSSIALNGDINAVKNNLLDVATLAAGQKIDLSNVNLAAIEPFLKKLGADTRLAGTLTGGIEVKAEGLGGLSANGQVVVAGLVFGGGPLGADQFQTQRIAFPVNITRTAQPDGDSLIKFENVGVQMSQGTIALTGQVSQKALTNLGKNQPPGSDGSLSISANITDVANIASQLKNTLKLQEGVQITSGAIQQQLTIALTKDKVSLSQNLKAEAAGTRNNQPITLKPITVTASAGVIPTGQPVPDVRDIKLAVQSAFATVYGGGDSLAKIDINGNFDLGKLQTEIAQFSDMGQTQLAGVGSFNINTSGDLARNDQPIEIRAKANLQNVKITGVTQQPIDQDRLAIAASGNLFRDKNMIDSGWVSIDGGDPASPLIEVDANANINLADGSLPWFELKKATITNLTRLQQQYGGLVPTLAEQKITIGSGAVHAQAAGSYVGQTLTLTKPATLAISNISISKEGRPVLPRENLNASAFGNIATKNGINATFTDLSLTTDSKMLMVTKSGSGPLTVTMVSDAVRGNGALTIAANLKPLTDLAQAFGPVNPSPDQPRLQRGQLDGTLTLAKADRPETKLNFDGKVTGLTIAAGQTNPIENEQITITLDAVAPDDTKNPIVANGKIGSSFINTTLGDMRIALGGAMLEMLQSANIDAQVPDARKLYALANSLAPTTAPAGVSGAPLEITSGSATLKAKLARNASTKSTTIDVTDAQITRLALKRGQQQYRFDQNAPINAKLAASIYGTDKLEQIEVNELNADARVATLSMPEKIVITGLQTERPRYKGEIKAQGTIEQVTPLLAVLQDAPAMLYAGKYDLSQKISTNGPVTVLEGSIDVNDFRVLADNRRDAIFTEPQVAIRNNLRIDPNEQKVQFETLTIDMPKSQALALSMTGGVNNWSNERVIRQNTKLDITYDLEKLWPILRPMLTPETQASLKDMKITGKTKQTFVLSGSYPSKPTFAESIKTLNADGGLLIDTFSTGGLSVQKFQPQIAMRRGVVTVSGQPAVANEGKLDLAGIKLDLTKPDPLLTIQRDKKLLEKVKLNPVLAGAIGNFGVVLFVGSDNAQGLLNITADECNGVPMGALIQKRKDARAKFTLSVENLQVTGIVPNVIAAAAELGTDGIRGSIPPSTVSLADGMAQLDLTVQIARQVEDRRSGRGVLRGMPLAFRGGMSLANLQLHDFVIDISPELVRGDFRRYAPNGLKVPLKGRADKPQLDFDPAKLIQQNLGGLLDQLGGNRNQDQPREPQRNQGR